MQAQFLQSIDQVSATDWNNLVSDANPFLNHALLAALEHHGAASKENGWTPQHLIVTEGDHLCGAVPLYLKEHSYGEFVFDWSWANAYTRAGLPYYPKLIAAVPYSPITGARLLLGTNPQQNVAKLLIDTAQNFALEQQLSSLHYLFIDHTDQQRLESHGLLTRHGCQFQWFNRNYGSFHDFLSTLTAKGRKKIRHERKRIVAQEVTIECLTGPDISVEQWCFFHQCYQSTFDKKANFAPLSQGFFEEIGANLNTQVLLLIASQNGSPVASALFLRNHDTLYGRYWGSLKNIDCLHFELCYYQAIEYCINHRLHRCESGAQGEHKVSRGFSPIPTYSAHWINHPQFRAAINQFVLEEKKEVYQYISAMSTHLPYRQS